MAKTVISYQSSVFLPTTACQEVTVCLDDVWKDRTISGLSTVKATIENAGRHLGSAGRPQVPRFENPRNKELFQYSLTVDLAQFQEETPGNPWVPTCEDVKEVVPYGCVADSAQELKDIADDLQNQIDANHP